MSDALKPRERRVVAAAIWHKGVLYTLPAPARHHHIIDHIWILSGDDFETVFTTGQGFVDQEGEFMDRRIARIVAEDAEQLKPGVPGRSYLMSEDVW